MLTIPLRVRGVDRRGEHFDEEGRTLTLNRHGACIRIARPLEAAQAVRLLNLVSHKEADFRVIGPVAPRTEKGGEWGLECADSKTNIWGIQFPPPIAGEADSSALLECRECHAVALRHVSLVQVEVLSTSGVLLESCETCRKKTPWGYAEKQVAMGAPPGEADMMAEARQAVQGMGQRRHRRIALRLPILVRDYSGGIEITKSENVSKGGFCFVSEKNYHVGEGLMVACPYSTSEQSIEVRAKIARRQPIEGSPRQIYGIRYDSQSG